MTPMEPAAWKQAWGMDRLTFGREDNRQLPPIARGFLASHGLPRVMIFEGTFEGANPFEIRFEPLSKKLVPYNSTVTWGDFYDAAQDQAWSEQLVIAEEEFCNGYASYCVHRSAENVTRIDVEIPEPEMFVNSNLPLFGESLLLATQWSDGNSSKNVPISPKEWKASLLKLTKAITAIDSKVSDGRSSFWPYLIDYIREGGPGLFEITSDPARSQSRF